jgi:PilZ domain
MTEERRQDPRYDYECLVLIARGAEGFIGRMDNVSTTGCCITRPDDWSLPVGAEIRLYLLIDLRHVFSVTARVMWTSDHFIGFQYLERQDLPL